MKQAFEATSKVIWISILIILICPLLILLGEWGYSEIRFQIWLGQDEHRFDFSGYDTTDELREALLAELPVGTPEEEVQAFRMANGYSYRKPNKTFDGDFGIGMQKSQHSNRGFFGLRVLLPGIWIIFFELDPTDHTLVDIEVIWHPGP